MVKRPPPESAAMAEASAEPPMEKFHRMARKVIRANRDQVLEAEAKEKRDKKPP